MHGWSQPGAPSARPAFGVALPHRPSCWVSKDHLFLGDHCIGGIRRTEPYDPPRPWLMDMAELERACRAVWGESFELDDLPVVFQLAVDALADGDADFAQFLATTADLPVWPDSTARDRLQFELQTNCRSWSDNPRIDVEAWLWEKSEHWRNQPRVPEGEPGGGRWAAQGGGSSPSVGTGPSEPGKSSYDFRVRPGIGHNNPPEPIDDLPARRPEPPDVKVTAEKPAKVGRLARAIARRAFWVALRGGFTPQGIAVSLIAEGGFFAVEYLWKELPAINSFFDGPQPLSRLQDAAQGGSRPGYQKHHILEQTPNRGKVPDEIIDDPRNLVSIPTYKHELINGYYGRPRTELGGLSPRQYLEGKSIDEKYQFGLGALKKFGIME